MKLGVSLVILLKKATNHINAYILLSYFVLNTNETCKLRESVQATK